MLRDRPHKVLGISTDYAFCLHSKERVPYHMIIKVAFTNNHFKEDSYDESPIAQYEASMELNDDLDMDPETEMQELGDFDKQQTTENLLIPSESR